MLKTVILSAAFLLTICGCATMQTTPIEKTAVVRFPQVPDALQNENYTLIADALAPELRQTMNKEKFSRLCQDLNKNGEIIQIQFIGTLQGDVFSSELWKIHLRKKTQKKSNAGQEKLLRILIGTLDNQPKIFGIMIQ